MDGKVSCWWSQRWMARLVGFDNKSRHLSEPLFTTVKKASRKPQHVKPLGGWAAENRIGYLKLQWAQAHKKMDSWKLEKCSLLWWISICDEANVTNMYFNGLPSHHQLNPIENLWKLAWMCSGYICRIFVMQLCQHGPGSQKNAFSILWNSCREELGIFESKARLFSVLVTSSLLSAWWVKITSHRNTKWPVFSEHISNC